MKKALLLGAMAFLAINIATVQTSNAQVKVKGQKSTDELKIEKEKNTFSNAGVSNMNAEKTAGKDINSIEAPTNNDTEKAPMTRIKDGKAAPSQAAAEKAPAKIKAPRKGHANVSNNRKMAGSNTISSEKPKTTHTPLKTSTTSKPNPTAKQPAVSSLRPKGNNEKVEGTIQEVKNDNN